MIPQILDRLSKFGLKSFTRVCEKTDGCFFKTGRFFLLLPIVQGVCVCVCVCVCVTNIEQKRKNNSAGERDCCWVKMEQFKPQISVSIIELTYLILSYGYCKYENDKINVHKGVCKLLNIIYIYFSNL